jgi:predicted CopG family antitoxin
MAKMISVSDELKEILDKTKDKEGHQSLDSVIRIWKAESDAYRMLQAEKQKK